MLMEHSFLVNDSNIHFIIVDFCSPLRIDNAGIDYHPPEVNGRFSAETAAFITCNYGYFRSGPEKRICQTGGVWDGERVECITSK